MGEIWLFSLTFVQSIENDVILVFQEHLVIEIFRLLSSFPWLFLHIDGFNLHHFDYSTS